MFPHLFLILVLTMLSGHALSQRNDSLLSVLDTAEGPGRVKTLNELFRAHSLSDPVKAVGYSREALTLATAIGDKRGLAASCNNLGVAYRNQGALDKALEYYLTSLRLYDSLGNREGIATTKNNIANIYSMKKDYAQAMRYLEDSHAIFRELGDPFRLIGSMNNLGNLYRDIDLNEKALEYYSEALSLGETNGVTIADVLNNIGNIHFSQGYFDKAIMHYEKALAIERAQKNNLGVLSTVTNLGITFTRARQPAKAQRYLDEALKLSDKLQARTALPAIYKARAENFSLRQQWMQAYRMLAKYDEIREQIHSEESNRNIARMEMVLRFQEKERELELLRKQDEIKSLELRNTRLFIISIIMAVVLVIGGVNIYYTDRRRKLV